jgi:hypothetical protein
MDSAHNNDVMTALSLIEGVRLPHPYGPLLSAFIEEALNPVAAARYVRNIIGAGEIHSLLSDWTYVIESSNHPPHFPGVQPADETSKSQTALVLHHRRMPLLGGLSVSATGAGAA